MADLTTFSQVEAELAATANYRTSGVLSDAQRRVAALTRKLDFAEQSDEEGREIRFNHQVVENQLNQAIAFFQTKQAEITEQLPGGLNPNPSVVHSDFSGFGGYQ